VCFSFGMSLQECQKYVKGYITKLGTPEKPMYLGPTIKGRLDAYYVVAELGVNCIINLMPLTDEVAWDGETNRASAYMAQYGKEGETIEELEQPPSLYREAHLPLDPIEQQSEKNQIEWYAVNARKIASYLKENPKMVPYFHYKDGTNEDAITAFLVWYILDKNTCPWENLTEWLISDEIDQRQVLQSDEQIELFKKIVKHLDSKKENPIMANWLKKIKRSNG